MGAAGSRKLESRWDASISTAIKSSFFIRLLRQALSGQMRFLRASGESDDAGGLIERGWAMHDDRGRLCKSCLGRAAALGPNDQ